MARILMPEEELCTKYAVLTRPPTKTSPRRGPRICAIVCALPMILLLVVVLAFSTRLFLHDGVLQPEPDKQYQVVTLTSASDIPIGTVPSAAFNKKNTNFLDVLNLYMERWNLFLNGTAPATRIPPNPDANVLSIVRKIGNNFRLYVEVHKEEMFCLAFLSFANAFESDDASCGSGDLKSFKQRLMDHSAEFYRRLEYNLTAIEEISILGLGDVFQSCRDLSIIPVRQVQKIPKDRFEPCTNRTVQQ